MLHLWSRVCSLPGRHSWRAAQCRLWRSQRARWTGAGHSPAGLRGWTVPLESMWIPCSRPCSSSPASTRWVFNSARSLFCLSAQPEKMMHAELQLSKSMLLVSLSSVVQGQPSKKHGKAGNGKSCDVRRCPSIAAMRHLYWGCASSSVLQRPSIRRHGHSCTFPLGPGLRSVQYWVCIL